METKEFIQFVLAILVPIFAFLGWIYSRLDKKFDKIETDFKDVRKDLQSLDSRIARIEGQLIGPPHSIWEPKVKEKE